jgi:cation:H+ antiporter
MNILLFLGGLAFLIVGAEALVRGASRIAAVFGVSPLVIGLTVVAFGTSSPEIAVSVNAALAGQASLVLGNVVGSNIFNILFILGLSAIIVPLLVSQQLIRLELPLMIGLSLFILLLALDSTLSRLDGLILLVGLVGHILLSLRASRNEKREVQEEYAKEFGQKTVPPHNNLVNVILVVVGLGLLILGSRWLVQSAVAFAQFLGLSELIIGLTIIAAGTSLPEVVTSIIAALRGERDIAVGNVVGSNIFNLLGVLGLSSVLAPAGIAVSEAVVGFDLPVMIAVALASFPIFFTGGYISRWEGGFLLIYYVAYTLYLVLSATAHDTLPRFNLVMLYFVIPLSVVTLAVTFTQEMRRRQARQAA